MLQSEVAAVRGIKPSTIVSHLSDCIRAGFPIDVERLNVTDEVEKLIVDVIRKPPINSGNIQYSIFVFTFIIPLTSL